MNKKALVFAAIFLAAALVSPVFVLIMEANANQHDIDNINLNMADETQITEYLQTVNERHQAFLMILVIAEVVFVSLFAVALWFALTV